MGFVRFFENTAPYGVYAGDGLEKDEGDDDPEEAEEKKEGPEELEEEEESSDNYVDGKDF